MASGIKTRSKSKQLKPSSECQTSEDGRCENCNLPPQLQMELREENLRLKTILRHQEEQFDLLKKMAEKQEEQTKTVVKLLEAHTKAFKTLAFDMKSVAQQQNAHARALNAHTKALQSVTQKQDDNTETLEEMHDSTISLARIVGFAQAMSSFDSMSDT